MWKSSMPFTEPCSEPGICAAALWMAVDQSCQANLKSSTLEFVFDQKQQNVKSFEQRSNAMKMVKMFDWWNNLECGEEKMEEAFYNGTETK